MPVDMDGAVILFLSEMSWMEGNDNISCFS